MSGSERSGRRRWRRSGLLASGAAAAAALATGTASVVTARRVVSARPERPDDVEVLGVGAGSVTLRADANTVAPGRYGLWLDRGSGHARLGAVVDHDEAARTVTRRLLGVDRGRLREGPARWNQYFYCGDPASALGLDFEEIVITSAAGSMPAWFVPPERGRPQQDRWAVLVHGYGATREEGLRALPVLHRLGIPVLVISYRTDAGVVPAGAAPRSHHLGASEWVDVEAAVLHALSAGARDVVLVGWSMGGAICLALTDRSWTADRVKGLVLDAPVVDWRHVLDHQTRLNRVPAFVGRTAQTLLEHPVARRLAHLDEPLPLDRMNWVRRAEDLSVPVLLIHSDDDEFVPAGPSRRLAAARPDLVTLVTSRGAGHTKEWNVDPEAWEMAVARFLLDL